MKPPTLLLSWVVTFCIAAAGQAAPNKPKTVPATPTVQGLLVDVSKAENTDNGQISVLAGSATAATNYTVTPNTQFQIVRGSQVTPSSFLREHRGESVNVFVTPGSNPPTADIVQVVLPPLPPPPPPHLVRPSGPPKPGHIHGTVVFVTPTSLLVQLYHYTPPPPVLGTITDVTKAEDDNTGRITIQSNGKPATFLLNGATYFEQDQGKKHTPSSFLAEHKGEQVLIFPRSTSGNVAARVAVLIPVANTPNTKPQANANPKPQGNTTAKVHNHFKPNDHVLGFTLANTTKFSRHRDGQSQPANLAAVVVGEEVSVQATGVHTHIAATVEVLLPHSIHGQVVSANATSLTLKGHHKGGQNQPAQDANITVPLAATTHLAAIDGKTTKPATLADLKAGTKVVVLPASLPPHAAEAVEVQVVHATPHKVTVNGVVAGTANGTLLVKVHHPAKGNAPATDTQELFHFTNTTAFAHVAGKDHKAATAAQLKVGADVVVHAQTGDAGTPAVAEKVEIHAKETPKPNTKPHENKPNGKPNETKPNVKPNETKPKETPKPPPPPKVTPKPPPPPKPPHKPK